MKPFNKTDMAARPYQYILLLHDFINKVGFDTTTGSRVVFDYMGDTTKFFSPDHFSTKHHVSDAIRWMKSGGKIFFKAGDKVYPLENVVMPDEYDNGKTSDLYHALVGIAILCKLQSPSDPVIKTDMDGMTYALDGRPVKIGKMVVGVESNIEQQTINIIQSPMFYPLLQDEIRYALGYVNRPNVFANINAIESNQLKLVICENRGITTDDVKLYARVKGAYKEVRLQQKYVAK